MSKKAKKVNLTSSSVNPLDQLNQELEQERKQMERDGRPFKTFAEILQEHPDHAGGLAQLAEAEKDAKVRSNR